MHSLIKLIIIFFTGVGILVVLAVSLFVLTSNGLLWHSDTFNSMDRNNNGELSYSEWMAFYSYQNHSHSLTECGRSDFYQADCDVDDALTWREYHNFRFKHKRCRASDRGGWAPPSNIVTFQESEIDPPVLHALSGNQSHLPQEYRNQLRDRGQKLADRESELMEKHGISRP